MELTAERLRALLIYDPETGLFTRRVSRQGFWAGTQAGTLITCGPSKGYIYVGVDRGKYRAHRLAWLYMTGEWPRELDHINRDRADNRWANLREASRSQNNINSKNHVNNTSGHKGVNWVARANSWRAYVSIDGRQKHLGYFKDFNVAVTARNEAAKRLFGEFAD